MLMNIYKITFVIGTKLWLPQKAHVPSFIFGTKFEKNNGTYWPTVRTFTSLCCVISLGAGDWILGRTSDCFDEGSVRTLKNKFKSTGRTLNDELKYTVGGSDVLATRVETSVPRRGIVTWHCIWLGKVPCEKYTSTSGVAVWSYWLTFLIINSKLHFDLYII